MARFSMRQSGRSVGSSDTHEWRLRVSGRASQDHAVASCRVHCDRDFHGTSGARTSSSCATMVVERFADGSLFCGAIWGIAYWRSGFELPTSANLPPGIHLRFSAYGLRRRHAGKRPVADCPTFVLLHGTRKWIHYGGDEPVGWRSRAGEKSTGAELRQLFMDDRRRFLSFSFQILRESASLFASSCFDLWSYDGGGDRLRGERRGFAEPAFRTRTDGERDRQNSVRQLCRNFFIVVFSLCGRGNGRWRMAGYLLAPSHRGGRYSLDFGPCILLDGNDGWTRPGHFGPSPDSRTPRRAKRELAGVRGDCVFNSNKRRRLDLCRGFCDGTWIFRHFSDPVCLDGEPLWRGRANHVGAHAGDRRIGSCGNSLGRRSDLRRGWKPSLRAVPSSRGSWSRVLAGYDHPFATRHRRDASSAGGRA